MGIPEIVVTAWMCYAIWFALEQHGKAREGIADGRYVLTFIAILFLMLYWGGFYS